MRQNRLYLTLGLMLAAAAPAAAGDYGSIKDRGGVEIPAPIPVPESFRWYVRADLGGGILQDGGATPKDGHIYGFDRDPHEGPAFGLLSSWFNNGFDTFAVGGVGAGAYVTPRIRADLTIDARTKSDVDVNGSYRYHTDPVIYGAAYRVDGDVKERIEVRGTTALLNVYYDFADPGSRFVPYIGAGIGLVARSIDRRHSTVETVVDPNDPSNVVGTTTMSGKSKAHQVAPAAAAMAGVGVSLGHGLTLDLNYRFTYLGSVDNTTQINFSDPINDQSSTTSRVTIGDTFEHAIRAGLRWNVW